MVIPRLVIDLFPTVYFFQMCGIAGQVNFDGSAVSPEVLKNMTDRIAQRPGWRRSLV